MDLVGPFKVETSYSSAGNDSSASYTRQHGRCYTKVAGTKFKRAKKTSLRATQG